MAALRLHHAIFTNDKDSDLPLRPASSFLRPAPERDESPTSQLYSSSAYQDLIQRQPTHPNGPTRGWDLGLNLLGDPITAAECKSIEDHQTKMKLRRLHTINIMFELLFGLWGTYATIRYFLAFAHGSGDAKPAVYALILGITSALAVVLVTISILMPLLPQQGHLHARRYSRSLFRASYLLLLCAGAVINLVLVLVWHPTRLCHWDLDISWYTSTTDGTVTPCHTAPLSAWIAAAVLRLVVTLTVALSFIYILRSYHKARHPAYEGNGPEYSLSFSSDPEDISPISTSSPPHLSKSALKFTRSDDSNHTLSHSNITFPKTSSISTLAPSSSCTGHSRSHSVDNPLPRISPPTSRRTSTHGSSPTQLGSETPSQTQSVSDVTAASSPSHTLRRMNCLSATQVAPDVILSDISVPPEGFNTPMTARDPPEIRYCAPWKPGHRGTGVRLDVKKTSLAWENTHVRHASQASVGLESFSSACDEGESIKEMDTYDDVYSYGYGVSGPTYPYLDMYNPHRPDGYTEASSSCDNADEYGLSRGHRRAIPGGAVTPDVCSEPRSSLSREDEESSGEEEEYVAMMGGFVRRMATIESLGSKEAAGTLSTTGSVALHSMRSGAVTPQFSSGRFTDSGSSRPSSVGVPSGRESSLGTAYLSFSSGGTGMQVNECGELLPCRNSGAGSSYDRQYYTASDSPCPRLTPPPSLTPA